MLRKRAGTAEPSAASTSKTSSPTKTSRFGRASASNKSSPTKAEDSSDEETVAEPKPVPVARKSMFAKTVTVGKGKAPPVPAQAKITVRFNGLELFETKNGSALIEFDMLGSEKKPTRTPSEVLVRGKTDFQDFEKQYDASEGSALCKAIGVAFQSVGDEDEGELEFVVYKVDDKGGKEMEVGVAVLSLEEMLDNKKDHSGTLRVLDSNDKEVGKLTCEVTALAVLQQIDAATDASKAIRIEAAQLRFVDGARVGGKPVRLTVGLSGEAGVQSKPVAPDKSNTCDLDFKAAFPVVEGGALAQRLQGALREPADGAEGRVRLMLHAVPEKAASRLSSFGVSRRGDLGELLGEASISLPELLKGGRDTRSASLVLHKPAPKAGVLSRGKAPAAAPVEVATLTVSVTAVDLLRELERTAAAAAPAAAAPAAARSRSSSPTVAKRTRRREVGSEAAVQISFASFAFSRGAPAREMLAEQKIKDLWVVATAGDAEAETSRQRVDEFRCDFDDEQATLAFGAGSALRAALEAALHSDAAADGAQLTLTLKGKGGRKEHTLGTATFDLLGLLDKGGDLRDAKLTFKQGREEVGELTCSISALAALRELEEQRGAAGTGVAASTPAAAAAESGVHRRRRTTAQATESVGVKLTHLEISVGAAKYLTAQVRKRPHNTRNARDAHNIRNPRNPRNPRNAMGSRLLPSPAVLRCLAGGGGHARHREGAFQVCTQSPCGRRGAPAWLREAVRRVGGQRATQGHRRVVRVGEGGR